MSHNVLVLGASLKEDRVSFQAVMRLDKAGYEVYAVGVKAGHILHKEVQTIPPMGIQFHTITLYLNPQNQRVYYEYILQAKPQRLIFNPGTENPELEELAHRAGILTQEACTLVLLATAQF